MAKNLGHILIVGCGSTGTEVLKQILLSYKYDSLTLVDNDKIELSNLSRQWFYNKGDIGQYKSDVMQKKIKAFKENIVNIRNAHSSSYIHRSTTLGTDIFKYSTANIICKKIAIEDFVIHENFEFDIIFSCVDTVSTRMSINLIKTKILIDMGVEGYNFHIKKVSHAKNYRTPCLYCIKDLYNTDDNFYFCTLRDISKYTVAKENRLFILKNTIATLNSDNVALIVKTFNIKVPHIEHQTNVFEVEGLLNNILPNICCVNAICAGLAFVILDDEKYDYYFYDSSREIRKYRLSNDENCIVCGSSCK